MNGFTFEIKKTYGVVREEKSGWKEELNLVSWNGNPPKLDIRSWSNDHIQMSKGLTFTVTEAETLYGLLTVAFVDTECPI